MIKGTKGTDETKEIELGQFFLENQEFFKKIVDLAAVQPGEVVLEIGAGDGRMTKLLAEKTKRVIAVEIDKEFEKGLKKISPRVEVVIEDILKYLPLKKNTKFNKILGNLPSTVVEPLFNGLHLINFEKCVFLIPEKFAYKLEKFPAVFLYHDFKLIEKVDKKSFKPVPRTNWEIVVITKKTDPLKTGNLSSFLQQFVFEHSDAKLKNSLMEALIRFSTFRGKNLTKNQARKIVAKAKINPKLLESISVESSNYGVIIKSLSKLVFKD